jgi:uncharacterized repeat protein (TIGR01451 family)
LNTANNIATALTTVGSLADVSVSLSIPTSAIANSTVTGTVTFFNLGNTAADNATRTIVLSGGTLTAVVGGTISTGSTTATFAVVSLPPTSSASFIFTYVVPTTGSVSATASIATTTTETNVANNVAAAVTSVNSSAVDLSVSLSINPSLLSAGSNTVNVSVTNVGGAAATGTLVLTMPDASTVGFTLTAPLATGQSISFNANYSVPLLTSVAQTFTAIVNASKPDVNLANNTSTLIASVGANLKGLAWIDANRDRAYQVGEAILPNLLVRLYAAGSIVVGTSFTGVDGRYEIRGMTPGTGYRVEFFNCVDKNNLSTCAALSTTPYNQTATTAGGQTSTGVTTVTSTTSGATVGQAISAITLYAGDNTVDQNLPLDPRGQIYDAVTRQPVANVTVRLNGPFGFAPNTHLMDLNGAQANNESTTGLNGLYQFIFVNNPPAGVYTLEVISVPAGYRSTVATGGGVAQPNVIANVTTLTYVVPSAPTNMQPGYAAPGVPPLGVQGSAAVGASGTQYVTTLSFAFGVGYVGELFNNHIPLDPVTVVPPGPATTTFDLTLNKAGPAVLVGGGTGTFTLAISNPGPGAAADVVLTDVMPSGLTLLSASVQPANALALNVTPANLSASAASLPAGVTTVTLVVRAETSAVGSTITNIASVATTTAESNTANNVSSAVTRVLGADMGVVKAGPANLVAGGTASYTLTVFNAGPSAAANVTVTDILPAGLSLKSATVRSGSFSLITTTGALTGGRA